jgi:D-glycero-beta-D-manno-heptose 1-phosphate adenylyltransferase
MYYQACLDKVVDWQVATRLVQGWKAQGLEIVFTNGCFDLLHLGHLKYLAEARGLGGKLVVGINSDASVRKLKGEQRPIHGIEMRTVQMAALAFVDLVVVFEQDTPLQLIELLTPDVLVKGGDYAPEQIVGADWVVEHGGDVKSLEFVEGMSTTKLIEDMKGRL